MRTIFASHCTAVQKGDLSQFSHLPDLQGAAASG